MSEAVESYEPRPDVLFFTYAVKGDQRQDQAISDTKDFKMLEDRYKDSCTLKECGKS